MLPRNSAAQASQSNSGSSSSSSQSNSNTQAQTDQYTLSHERYEKAVSYSRAGYTLYFISYFIGTLVLWLLLRLGVAAKFRDMAESASGNKWIQGLIFIPLFILTTDIFDLPVRVYWHALSLRYEQSVQRWGSWLVDWLKGELLGIGLSVAAGDDSLSGHAQKSAALVVLFLACGAPFAALSTFHQPVVHRSDVQSL